MNFLSRAGGAIIVMLPTGVVAFALMYGAWYWKCGSLSCRVLDMLVMLTGIVLAVWSLIILATFLMAGSGRPSIGQALRANTTEILPAVLFYAAFTGAMAYSCLTMFNKQLAGSSLSENKLLLLSALFLPIYELTRVMERKKIENAGFSTQILLHAQSLLTFAGWYYLMMFILQNREAFPAFDKAAKWQFLYVMGVMATASFILYKCYDWAEKYLRAQGIIKWDSKYFGKD